MIRSALAAIALLAVLAAPAAAKKLTPTRAAARAVTKLIRQQAEVTHVKARCIRLTGRRWRCTWTATDVLDDRCNGDAKVTSYKYAYNVSWRNLSDDVYCDPA